jgi:choline-glycine betaine transporter
MMTPTFGALLDRVTALEVSLGVATARLDAALVELGGLRQRDRQQSILIAVLASGGTVGLQHLLSGVL